MEAPEQPPTAGPKAGTTHPGKKEESPEKKAYLLPTGERAALRRATSVVRQPLLLPAGGGTSR